MFTKCTFWTKIAFVIVVVFVGVVKIFGTVLFARIICRLTKLESYKKELELKLHKQEALPFVDLYELARTTYGANDEPNTTLIAFWRLIFEFKGTSEKDIRGLIFLC